LTLTSRTTISCGLAHPPDRRTHPPLLRFRVLLRGPRNHTHSSPQRARSAHRRDRRTRTTPKSTRTDRRDRRTPTATKRTRTDRRRDRRMCPVPNPSRRFHDPPRDHRNFARFPPPRAHSVRRRDRRTRTATTKSTCHDRRRDRRKEIPDRRETIPGLPLPPPRTSCRDRLRRT
jgi:hypothetical protein